MPRAGLFSMEVWWPLAVILCGLIMTVTISFSLLMLLVSVWLLAADRALPWGFTGPFLLAAITFCVLELPEPKKTEPQSRSGGGRADWVRGFSVVLLPVVVGVGNYCYSPGVFAPVLWWVVAALIPGGVCRALLTRFFHRGGVAGAALERVAATLLSCAFVWAVFAGAYAVAVSLRSHPSTNAGTGSIAGSAAAFAVLFTVLRKWSLEASASSITKSAWQVLKPFVHQLIAAAALVLLFLTATLIVLQLAEHHWWLPGSLSAVVCLLAVFFYHPNHLGLHSFYRSRLSRCYLGASYYGRGGNPDPNGNRMSEEGPDDDMVLTDDEGVPVHLICCAANHLGGDLLPTLHRGSRSVVFSRFGIAMGESAVNVNGSRELNALAADLEIERRTAKEQLDGLENRTRQIPDAEVDPECHEGLCEEAGQRHEEYTVAKEKYDLLEERARKAAQKAHRRKLRLSSAMTASAAAFNSQMGSVSIRLGFPVSFLAATLNLRLGLWWASPKHGQDSSWPVRFARMPGRLFFKELLNLSRADKDMLHLSDGGHFENLGAYELIRRRCRHVVVCDASEDADFTFENLGNLVRRVREDFGVGIKLDVSPLKPGADGMSAMHAVTGTIEYRDGGEPGVIIYIKPNVTGDEEEDIRQYKASGAKFPHESTADQFFDEAQWEAYRCLGCHATTEAFGVLTKMDSADKKTPDQCFAAVRRGLLKVPWGENDAYKELVTRFSELEKELAKTAGGALLQEAYPERVFHATRTALVEPPEHELLSGLLHLTQTMSDIVYICRLEEHYNDPLAGPWSNYVERWMAIPSLRRWWPALKPLFGREFVSFAEERLGLPGNASLTPSIKCYDGRSPDREGQTGWHNTFAGKEWLKTRNGEDPAPGFSTAVLQLHPAGGGSISLGLLKYQVVDASEPERQNVKWNADDLWLPPGWRQGAMRAEFLQQLVTFFGSRDYLLALVEPGAGTGRSLAEYFRFGLLSGIDGTGRIELSPPGGVTQ
jgi:hypothetical protein